MNTEEPKAITPPKFVSLTQARATRDRLADSILWALEKVHPKYTARMVENVCCAGEGWAADAYKIADVFAENNDRDGAEQISHLREAVEWIKGEERRQLDAALAAPKRTKP